MPTEPEYPNYVVVDTRDGYVFSANEEGLFAEWDTAQGWADWRNNELTDDYYKVFRLIPMGVR